MCVEAVVFLQFEVCSNTCLMWLQELCYDYGYALNSVVAADGTVKEVACHCGSLICRKRMYQTWPIDCSSVLILPGSVRLWSLYNPDQSNYLLADSVVLSRSPEFNLPALLTVLCLKLTQNFLHISRNLQCFDLLMKERTPCDSIQNINLHLHVQTDMDLIVAKILPY